MRSATGLDSLSRVDVDLTKQVRDFVSEDSARPGAGSNPRPAFALRSLVQVAGAVPGAMARRAGLSHNEIAVLDLLSEHPLGPGEIARSLAVTSAAASGIIDRLVARGYAVRGPHPEDRRRTVVEISESGRAEIVGHLMPMITQLAALDDDLSEQDREVVLSYLTDATAAIHRLL